MNNVPVLPYLELPIVKHCNLNCRYCSHLASIEEEYYMSIDTFEHDLLRLSQLFADVTEMRLLGGEPLLHPHIGELIIVARRLFPKTNLKIATNGLLIPFIKNEILDTITACDVSFDISLYPPTQKIEPIIQSRLHEFGIRFYLSEPIDKFQKRLLPMTLTSDIKKSWYKCQSKNCFVLCEGNISCCYAPQIAEMVKNKFNYCVNVDDAIADIYYSKWTGKSLLKFLNRPHSCCAHCGEPKMFSWTFTGGNIDLSDWFVDKAIN